MVTPLFKQWETPTVCHVISNGKSNILGKGQHLPTTHILVPNFTRAVRFVYTYVF